jgi:flavin-dependent dehydrogenase
MKDLKPLSPIHGSRSTQNRFRHIPKASRWPDQFVVFGDAACHFNPFYGQGMSLVMFQAKALDECLSAGLTPLPKHFHERQARVVKGAWMMATSYDYRVPGCVGGPAPLYQRMMHKYIERVLKLVTKDPFVARTFAEVLHLRRQPAALLSPGIVMRAIRG